MPETTLTIHDPACFNAACTNRPGEGTWASLVVTDIVGLNKPLVLNGCAPCIRAVERAFNPVNGKET